MRRTLLALALLAVAAPLAAQDPAGHSHDPDHAVAGGGTLPAGWSARLDRADASLANVRVIPMGSGFHVVTGPAVLLWRPADSPAHAFTATATFGQAAAPAHPEAYGLFVGGKNLDGTGPEYLYFLVRGDGKYMVRHRANNGDLHTLVDWTASPAVHVQNDQGQATNTITIAATDAGVRYSINGTQVGEVPFPRAYGIVGLRVNHNLSVHISDFAITPAS